MVAAQGRRAREPKLVVGDIVSVAIRHFGESYAKSIAGRDWQSDERRDSGKIVGQSDKRWLVDFDDEGEVVAWERRMLRFVERTAAARPVLNADESEEDERNEADAEPEPAGGKEPGNPSPDVLRRLAGTGTGRARGRGRGRGQGRGAGHGRGNAAPVVEDELDEDSEELDSEQEEGMAEGGWQRNDNYAINERDRQGFSNKPGPVLNMPDAINKSFFEFCLSWFDDKFLTDMAAEMQEYGRGKGQAWAGWKVTLDDVVQWMGVWYYMLAFPQAGPRREYFNTNSCGFGPVHSLDAVLVLAENGRKKGLRWFENMQAAFTLPTLQEGVTPAAAFGGDDFLPVRRMWEDARAVFLARVSPSWLLIVDESMVKWVGRGMPGLMVVPRKPTPMGLELHTVCCAVTGILVNFEVYEGKERMETKQFVGDRTDHGVINKSTALTLRCVRPWFGSGRVLIADSWFGSVACAIELFRNGIFAIMNVKTGTRGFPKNELMQVVDEIKGKSEEARRRRRERRGVHAAYTKEFYVDGRQLMITAAGHIRKVPLLLVATASSLIPGEDHVKRWTTPSASGAMLQHELRTKQPEMHQLYRQNMNHVDLHNKLRQGVTSMADVWICQNWVDRHFAEMMGFTEVNIFKALKHFIPAYKDMPHGEFRRRLAWSFMTLGKAEYPSRNNSSNNSSASTSTARVNSAGDTHNGPSIDVDDDEGGLWEGREHVMKLFNPQGTERHACGYCGKNTRKFCATCEALGRGRLAVCGRRTQRKCIDKHAQGAPVLHGNWKRLPVCKPKKTSKK